MEVVIIINDSYISKTKYIIYIFCSNIALNEYFIKPV